MCTLNIRSFTNPLHYTAIADFADTHNIDVFALSETWIFPNTTSAQLFDAIPHGFTFISTPRPVPDSRTSSTVGGGTAFLLRESCKLLSTPTTTTTTFKSFELSTVTITLPHSNLDYINVSFSSIFFEISALPLSSCVSLTSFYSVFLSPLVILLSHLVLKLQTDLVIIPLLFCGPVSHLIYVELLITSLIRLY